MKEPKVQFVDLVKRVFAYLPELGFEPAEIEKTPVYTSVDFKSKNVAIAFSEDFKEGGYFCYVGKLVDGKINVDRTKVGYWSTLQKYAIDYFGYRGVVSLNFSGGDVI